MPILDSYYKVPEAAALLGVHPETKRRLCQQGRIPAEKVRNTWLTQKEVPEEFAPTYRNPRRINKSGSSPTSSKRDKERSVVR